MTNPRCTVAKRTRSLSPTIIGMLGMIVCATGGPAAAQSLTVLPVTATLQPRQMATVLTLVNKAELDTSVQVRVFTWKQTADGQDLLEPSDAVAVSPPLGTIAAGRKQIIRLVLRRPAQDREASYRILIDQIPGPAQPNEVRVALRLSLPVFAEPSERAVPRLRFSAETTESQVYLVATNEGKRHDAIRDIQLKTVRGDVLKPDAGQSPYVLPGVTRRWRLTLKDASSLAGQALRLTAAAELSGVVDQSLAVGAPR